MKRLEKLGLKPVEDWENERLARWLFEWELMQNNSGSDDAHNGVSGDKIPADCIASLAAEPDDPYEI